MLNFCRNCFTHLKCEREKKIKLCNKCLNGFIPSIYSKNICSGYKYKFKCEIFFRYDQTTKQILQDFKLRKHTLLAEPISNLIMENINLNNEPDIITAVPSHFFDTLKRGFTPSILIAEKIASKSGIKSFYPIYKKSFNLFNRNKKLKSKKERIEQKNNFYIPVCKQEKLYHKKIMIIDDIYTTGTTIKQCSKILLDAGAASVTAILFALTPR